MDEVEVRSIWKNVDAVCFDVDSTVIEGEAIDELAAFCGKREEVTALTKSAMSGKIDFREALKARLEIISPTMEQLKSFTKRNPFTFTKNLRRLIELLHQKNIPVYLISGGFRGILGSIAIDLNIPLQNIYANKLTFNVDGSFLGFDESEPTSRNGGKANVIRELKEKYKYSRLVMIGDGITDLEACPPADAFIGFGGNVVREQVKSKAKWYVMDFQELIDAL